jgi:hypothetical protein
MGKVENYRDMQWATAVPEVDRPQAGVHRERGIVPGSVARPGGCDAWHLVGSPMPYLWKMKLVVEVKDSKAELLLEFLRTLTYVKVKRQQAEKPTAKEEVLEHVREAVEEMKLVKAGKLKGRDAMAFLDEL